MPPNLVDLQGPTAFITPLGQQKHFGIPLAPARRCTHLQLAGKRHGLPACANYRRARSSESIGLAAMDVTKPYKYSMSRNNGSGPEIGLPGRILAGLVPGKHRHRPSGRPSAGQRTGFSVFPVAVRPISGPEGRFMARNHYCVT